MSETPETLYYKQRLVLQNESELNNRMLSVEARLTQLEYIVNHLKSQNTTFDSDMVSVRTDEQNEYIDIDFQTLELDKFYLVQYHGETYAVRKISQYHIAFYDVVKK